MYFVRISTDNKHDFDHVHVFEFIVCYSYFGLLTFRSVGLFSRSSLFDFPFILNNDKILLRLIQRRTYEWRQNSKYLVQASAQIVFCKVTLSSCT